MSDVSGASLSNGIAGVATGMKSQEIKAGITSAVLKQVKEQQKMIGQALVNMIQQAPSFDLQVGRNLDISA